MNEFETSAVQDLDEEAERKLLEWSIAQMQQQLEQLTAKSNEQAPEHKFQDTAKHAELGIDGCNSNTEADTNEQNGGTTCKTLLEPFFFVFNVCLIGIHLRENLPTTKKLIISEKFA